MKKILPLFAAMLLTLSITAQDINTVLLFESNGPNLKTSSSEKLEKIFDNTKPGERISFEMMGAVSRNYSSEDHSNMALSRANLLIDVLVQFGVSHDNIELKSQEIFQPTVCKEPYTVYTVSMIMPGTLITEPLMPAQDEPQRMLDLSDYVLKETQHFTVDPQRTIIVKGEEGTVVTFPAYSFVYANGTPVTGDVDIELEEFYSSSDLLAHGLTTMSDGRLIESGGTIYVQASCNGQAIKMAPGAEFVMDFPIAGAELEGMQTFTGTRLSDGTMNWTVPQEDIVGVLDQAYNDVIDGVYDEILINDMNIDQYQWNNINNNNRGYYQYYGEYGIDTAAMTVEEKQEYYAQLEYQENTGKMDSYMLSSSELGWINCDRFYDVVAEEKTNLIVQVEGDPQAAVRLVFSDIKCVMGGYGTNENIAFNSIPIGQKATVIAYYMIDDQPYFAMQEVTIPKDGKVTVEPLLVSETELKKGLESLDS